jgi:hypothetical protein
VLRQKDNRDNYLGSTVFMVLFIFFICAFAGTIKPPAARDSHYKSVSEQKSYVIALNDAQQYSTPKNIIRRIENTDFKTYSDSYKIFENNRSAHHSLLSLQKAELLIKPVIHRLFYIQCHSIDTDDLPLLG